MPKDRNGSLPREEDDDGAEERHRHRRSKRKKEESSDGEPTAPPDEKERDGGRKRRKRGKHHRGLHRGSRRSRGSISESEKDEDSSTSASFSDSSSEDSSRASDSEESEGEVRRRKRRERRRKEREHEKEKRRREKDRRRRKARDEEKRKKEKAKKKKEKKEKDLGKKGAVTNSWGKYGVIRETDMWNKRPEFTAWLAEVKKVNLESLANWEEKQMFKEFMEDHNTATFPSKKYYGLDAYHQHMMAKEMKKGIKKASGGERTIFNDEELRRQELLIERERQKDEQVEALKRSMQSGMAQAMKEQAQLKEEMAYQYKVGNIEAAHAIQRRLDPDTAM